MTKEKRILQNAMRVPDVERIAREQEEDVAALSPKELAEVGRELDAAFPGGFSVRDEANALIAMAVRNGPIEDLHAGRYSTLLEDHSLSRMTDDEMKTLMIHATDILAKMLRFRDEKPDMYRRWLRGYGMTYCREWQRE